MRVSKTPLFLSPGAIKYLLAIIGIVFGLRNPQFRRWASFLLAIAILAFFLSLGPNFRLGDFQPWWWLSEHIPGFDRVRSVMRFAFFVQISVIIFAALGINGLYRWSRDRFTKPKSQTASRLAVAAIAFTALANGYPTKSGPAYDQFGEEFNGSRDLTPLDKNKHQKWLEYVEKNTPADQGILCLPVAPGPRVRITLGPLSLCIWGLSIKPRFLTDTPAIFRNTTWIWLVVSAMKKLLQRRFSTSVTPGRSNIS
jgi:hypothetical protein